jgi:hypothetical protein
MLFRRGSARTQWLSTEGGGGKYLWWEGVKRRRILPRTRDTPARGSDTVSAVLIARAPELPCYRTARDEAVHLYAVRFSANSLNDIKSSRGLPFLSSVLGFRFISSTLSRWPTCPKRVSKFLFSTMPVGRPFHGAVSIL